VVKLQSIEHLDMYVKQTWLDNMSPDWNISNIKHKLVESLIGPGFIVIQDQDVNVRLYSYVQSKVMVCHDVTGRDKNVVIIVGIDLILDSLHFSRAWLGKRVVHSLWIKTAASVMACHGPHLSSSHRSTKLCRIRGAHCNPGPQRVYRTINLLYRICTA
jgi:hypothetical protein